ncbi:MAG: RNA 2',3'-cyclic phosphodiesterase [bacterium]|nr:RNA 2',3'-cyclic phosphodiesterase [bacterium]
MSAKGIKEEIRSFIAIDLPLNFLEAIGRLQDELKIATKGVRWVRRGNIHLTLKFLGDIREELLGELGEILATTCKAHAPFELSIGRAGGFPNIDRPQVIWLGLMGDLEKLESLRQGIEKGCSSLGLTREKRPFHPHLTMGRIRNWRNVPVNLATLLNEVEAAPSGRFSVRAVHLYRSDLTRDGAVYTKLKSFPLKQEK